MPRRYLFFVLVITLFTGSIFLNSTYFVNRTITPQFYFCAIAFPISIIIIILFKLKIQIGNNKLIKLFSVIYSIAIIQAIYGIFQYLNFFESNSLNFKITGSFNNPAGFAACLSSIYPIGLYLYVKSKKKISSLLIFSYVILFTSVFLSESRTGIVALIVSTGVFIKLTPKIYNKIKQLRYYRHGLITLVASLITLSAYLFIQKQNSAIGRLLIWKVSLNMVQEKPFFGHGHNSFLANYMNYQAKYFLENPSSEYKQLADNVKQPFNEFLKILIEYGTLGFILILLFILLILRNIKKNHSDYKILLHSGFAAIFVFCCFTYPMQYMSVIYITLLYIILSFNYDKILLIKINPIIKSISKIGLIIISISAIYYYQEQIKSEINWKKIAIKSLNGCTKEMLPEYKHLYSKLKYNPYFLYNYSSELSIVNQFQKSNKILEECELKLTDYDTQMLKANNYLNLGDTLKAIKCYKHASNMIPSRFLPHSYLLNIYLKTGENDDIYNSAKTIVDMPIKILSPTVYEIKKKAEKHLNQFN